MASAGRNTAVLGGTGTTPTAANNVSNSSRKSPDGYRRPSQEGTNTMFPGLHQQKRGSQDSTAAARRASIADQSPPTGILGTMWNNYTRGSIDAEKK